MKLCVLALLPLIVCSQEAPKLRLPDDVRPIRYELDLNLTPSNDGFDGKVSIEVDVKKLTSVIWLHSSDLTIASATVSGKPAKVLQGGTDFIGLSGGPFAPGPARIEIAYSGPLLKNDVEGLFKQTDGADSYILTQFEPTSARRAIPCFDEPAFKTPWRSPCVCRKGWRHLPTHRWRAIASRDPLGLYASASRSRRPAIWSQWLSVRLTSSMVERLGRKYAASCHYDPRPSG